jgi:hypothetical protein
MPTKENLLIALGDSWTYGIGAYDQETLDLYAVHGNHEHMSQASRQFMTANCWPSLLSNMINYDVINLGRGGSANSSHAKWLINSNIEQIEQARDNYKNVIVIWLLTDSYRTSLYSNHARACKGIVDIHTRAIIDGVIDHGEDIKQFAKAFFQLSTDSTVDQDTDFYVKTVENYCQTQNFKFMVGNAFSNYKIKSTHNLHLHMAYNNFNQYLRAMQIAVGFDDKQVWSTICNHPSAIGYRLIAEQMRIILMQQGLLSA